MLFHDFILRMKKFRAKYERHKHEQFFTLIDTFHLLFAFQNIKIAFRKYLFLIEREKNESQTKLKSLCIVQTTVPVNGMEYENRVPMFCSVNTTSMRPSPKK